MSSTKIKVEECPTIELLIKELTNTPEEEVILVVEDGDTFLKNELNLRLLKFYAEEEEKEIIIKTSDSSLIALAQRFGISTVKEEYLSTAKIQMEREPNHQMAKKEVAASPEIDLGTTGAEWLQWHGGLQFAIIFSLFSLILACWWFFQPKAVVIIYPKEQSQTFSTDARVSTDYTIGDILKGKIPAKILEKDGQIKVQIVATGTKTIGATPAVGRLALINSTGQPVVLPKGSLVIGKAGVVFLTDQDVLVPKKHTKFQDGVAVGEEYGRAEVSITAEKKGTIGNQPAKAITVLSGKYQRFLKVINPYPTKNGSNKKVSVVTLDDVKKGENEAKRQMQLVGAEEASVLTGKENLYLPELVKLEIIRVTNAPDIGAESESLQTALEYRIVILTPSVDDISKYLVRRFEENIPSGFQAKSHQIELKEIKPSEFEGRAARLKLVGRGPIKGILNPAKIKKLIRGKSFAEANNLLIGQNEVARFKIDLKNNSGKVPRYAFQIKVILPAGGETK